MRIISGSRRGLHLKSPGKKGAGLIRPTADRARESLFNIISQRIAGGHILDLFAGTGALGLEALSRGGSKAVFVDYATSAIRLIEDNIQACKFTDQTTIIKKDINKKFSFLNNYNDNQFSLIFLDPPYDKGLCDMVLPQLAKSLSLTPNALIIAEENKAVTLASNYQDLPLIDQRTYGHTSFWFYQK